jgi:hypothetical protein
MSILNLLIDSTAKWNRNPPAATDAIQDLVSGCAIDLPDEYIEFLRFSNGGEGELGVDPGWFQIWPAEQVIQLNEGYKVTENIPGYFAFGSNGAGEMLVFDARSEQPWSVAMIPFIHMQSYEAKIIAPDFEAFVRQMGREFAG